MPTWRCWRSMTGRAADVAGGQRAGRRPAWPGNGGSGPANVSLYPELPGRESRGSGREGPWALMRLIDAGAVSEKRRGACSPASSSAGARCPIRSGSAPPTIRCSCRRSSKSLQMVRWRSSRMDVRRFRKAPAKTRLHRPEHSTHGALSRSKRGCNRPLRRAAAKLWRAHGRKLYLVSPIWRFWIGSDIFGVSCAGALIPSVDKVGRFFPLAILYCADDRARHRCAAVRPARRVVRRDRRAAAQRSPGQCRDRGRPPDRRACRSPKAPQRCRRRNPRKSGEASPGRGAGAGSAALLSTLMAADYWASAAAKKLLVDERWRRQRTDGLCPQRAA